jgi:predicted nuclease of predicted toxin-antitoxin system
LERAGYDVVWAGDWLEDPGDEEILVRAHDESRILVTLDKDFGELAVVRGAPHSGIIRIVGYSAREHGRACLQVLDRYYQGLLAGGLVTAQPGRVRFRPGRKVVD